MAVLTGMMALQQAAKDFHYLLNHQYPRKPSLELIGNRYGYLLTNVIFSIEGFSQIRMQRQEREKSLPSKASQQEGGNQIGHNVLITVEAALAGRPLVSSNDGFIRDISGLSGNFRKTKLTTRQFVWYWMS